MFSLLTTLTPLSCQGLIKCQLWVHNDPIPNMCIHLYGFKISFPIILIVHKVYNEVKSSEKFHLLAALTCLSRVKSEIDNRYQEWNEL